MSKLCRVCEDINFAAILTPRERDPETGECKAIFRPEWSGNGKDPYLGWRDSDETNNSDRHRYRATYIRTAYYDELSDSTRSYHEGDESEAGSEHQSSEFSAELAENLIEELSGSEESDEAEEGDDHRSELENEDPLPRELGHVTSDSRSHSEVDLENRSRRSGGSPGGNSSVPRKASVADHSEDGGADGSRHTRSISPSSPSRAPGKNSDGYSYDERGSNSSDGKTSSFTWSGDSRFGRSDKIDIRKQMQGNWGYRHGHFYNLGTIWDVRSRRYDCDLCYKLWQRMRNDWDVKNTFMAKSRCLLKLLEFKSSGNEVGSEREIAMLNLLFIFGFKTRLGWNIRLSYVFHGAHYPVQIVTADEVFSCPDEMFGEARTVGETCDFRLFKQWLAYCETEHHHDVPHISDDMVIRLIDVSQECLIEWKGSALEAPRFVALSYVWGNTPQRVLLTTSNIVEMMQPSILETKTLSRTIEDAINLVANIGERYLWIDALCIVQDSPEDQAIQIPQMYNIYSKAVLTIVAARGEDADAGLEGVGNNSRWKGTFALDLENIRVTMKPSAKLWRTDQNIGFKENYLSGCKYLSRAWTLQEALLSRRTLVFAYGQVYWECSTGTWCEGTRWESQSLRFIGQRAIKESTPIEVWEDQFDRKAYDKISGEEVINRVQPNSYECLVREYTQRHLSHDEDILNAFTGILTLIEKREQTRFFYALREKHFGNDLLFNITTSTPKRSMQRGAEMPSWSWLAWRYTAEFANEARNSTSDLVVDLMPCDGVKCYVLELDQNGKECLRVINETGGWQFRPNYVREGEGIWDPTWHHSSHPNPDPEETNEERNPGDEVIAWAAKVDAETNSTEEQTEVPITGNPPSTKDKSSTSENNDIIPTNSQDLTLSAVQSHPAIHHIKPSFHILFHTFSTLVELFTEEDAMTKRLASVIMVGTKRPRRNAGSSYRDIIQRNLYVCTPERERELRSPPRRMAEDRILAALKLQSPQRYRGPFFGRLPELSKAWNGGEYMRAVPDGLYTVLWMNNNQLPMLGHLLCRPAGIAGHGGGSSWDGNGILERVCGVVGPTEILTKAAQEKWRAKWGCVVLG